MTNLKKNVHDFWNEAACGEELFLKGETDAEKFKNQLKSRFEIEPYIPGFADFVNSRGKKVLEVGVGLGADHQMFAENKAILTGVDLTEKAVEYTQKRLEIFGLHSEVMVADAENLPFSDNTFDFVYSWGVIHHSPDTAQAASEIHRVLKPGGSARIMIYHKASLVGYMLWLRYALLKGRPFTGMNKIYSMYLESPGTKAYSIREAKELMKIFSSVSIQTQLSSGDLLSKHAGQRHRGFILDIARFLYPGFVVKKTLRKFGLFMLISLIK